MTEPSNELFIRINVVLNDLEKEIAQLPRKQVYYCKQREEIEALIVRMKEFIDSCYQNMSGTEEKERDLLNGMIDMAEAEIEEAEIVKYSLGYSLGYRSC